MNRILIVVVILQFLVILGLGLAYFDRSEVSSLETPEREKVQELPTKADDAAVRRNSAQGPPEDQRGSDLAKAEGESEAENKTKAGSFVAVYGLIHNAEGEPLEGGVNFQSAEGKSKSSYEQDGHYAAAGLEPGTWKYEFKSEGYRPLVGEFSLGDQPTVRLDVTLTRAVILRIRVLTPEGEPFPKGSPSRSLGVVATAEAPMGDFPRTPFRDVNRLGLGTYENGAFRGRSRSELAPEFIGKLALNCDLPIHVSLVTRHLVLETKLVPLGTEIVDFVLREQDLKDLACTFKIRLIDGLTNEPIKSAVIDVSDRQMSRFSPKKSEDGNYVEEDLTPGIMDLSVSVAGYGIYKSSLILDRGQVLDYGTLKLHPAASLEGKILDADGKGCVAQLHVKSIDSLAIIQDVGSARSATSDERGSYKLPELAPGSYVLQATNKEAKLFGQEVVEIRSGETTKRDVQLQSTVSLKISSRVGGKDLYFARLLDPAGIPVWHMHSFNDWTRELQFRPGSYRFEVYRDDKLLRYRDIKLGNELIELSIP